ncbi:hypothetical protein HRI_000771600 [Hibiscus trionum]|uniref:Growth-regulating factor n=1 Tax=Hibiscus trionum TaxID=183268 RepID=A0A9W7H5F7_HIBTR|nr:hypothetical protein HRI_000771600 [Hibiscus trionum]
MDLHQKQWRNQHESEQQPCAKIPKFLLDLHPHQQSEPSALPLFVSESESESNCKISRNMSAPLPDSNTRMVRYFSLAQWQELELQTLIYRYMLAGAAVPVELIQPIKKSLLYSSTYFLHHPYSHYQSAALLQSGYWGRAAMDPEPGQCRRIVGKKWRCSRDVVTGQKYCERHVHRGCNRSRKPVEMSTSSSTATVVDSNATTRIVCGASGVVGCGGASGAVGCGAVKAISQITMSNGPGNFGFSRPSPSIDLLGLRHRTLQDPDNSGANASLMSSATTAAMDGLAASNRVASMEGPLAKALQSSSTSNTSPTSVLHQLPRGCTYEISYINT